MSFLLNILYIICLGVLIIGIYFFTKWFNSKLAKKLGGYVILLNEKEFERIMSLTDEKADVELREKLLKAKQNAR
jgi:hypothetical protein